MILHGKITCLKYIIETVVLSKILLVDLYVFLGSMFLFCDYKFVLYSTYKLVLISTVVCSHDFK